MVEVLVRAIVISMIFTMLTPQLANAGDNTIIVEPIANSTGDDSLDPLSAGFSDLLVAYLSAYEGLEILYREDMHRIWQELARSRSGLEKTDTLRIGSLIQANTLIKGGFVKINGTFQANVHIYDIETTKLRYSLEQIGKIESVDTLASSMADRIADRLLSSDNASRSKSIDAEPLLNGHFMKGLGYHYNGLYDHAIAEFMQVLDLDPARADARLWLGRSYSAAGERDHAQIEYRRFLRDFPDHEDAESVRLALQ
jgi:tetratricopeptide (TPR) repeat protein